MLTKSHWVWPPRSFGATDGCPCVSTIQQKIPIDNLMSTTRSMDVDHPPPRPPPSPPLSFSNLSFQPVHAPSLPVQPFSVPNENQGRRLKLLFSKELSRSDVIKKTKIILPKSEAEFHLPHVQDGQRIRLFMNDKDINHTWCFSFGFRTIQNSRLFSLEGTRGFIETHGLAAKDSIAIYRDVSRRTFVIKALKSKREAPSPPNEAPFIISSSLYRKIESPDETCSFTYVEKLSEYKILDEMEKAVRPGTPYLYGNATLSDGDPHPYHPNHKKLKKLVPLESFRFFDLPLDHIFWT